MQDLKKGAGDGRSYNGLVLSSGEYHHRQRRLMQPAFHRSQIPGYMDTMRDVAVPRIEAWPDGGTLALDREMRSITLTVLTRTLLSSDIGREAIEEIERLLRVLLAELLPGGIIANIPALAWVPTRSNRRFAVASRRLGVMLTGIIDGYRAAVRPSALNRDARLHRDPGRFDPDRWAAGYSRTQMRASFFPQAGAERIPRHRDQAPGALVSQPLAWRIDR